MNGDFKTIPLPAGAQELRLAELPGDLKVEGLGDLQAEIRATGEATLEWSEADGVALLSGVDDLHLLLPARLALTLAPVRGDARILGIAGPVSVAEVNGDLRLRDVGPVTIGKVFGDLRAQDLRGDLRAETVYGDAVIREVRGAVDIERVQADAVLRAVDGRVRLSAGADASVEIRANVEHHLEAGADLRLTVAQGFAGELQLKAGGGIAVDLPEERATRLDDGRWQLRRDGGSAPGAGDLAAEGLPDADAAGDGFAAGKVYAVAGGDLRLSGPDQNRREARWQARVEFKAMGEEFRAIGDEFRQLAEKASRRFHEQVGGLGHQLQGRFGNLADNLTDILSAAGLSLEEAEAVSERVRRAGERAGQRAQERMEQLRQRQESMASEHRRGSWGWIGQAVETPPPPPPPPAPPAPPAAGNDERMVVLRLLEAGRISTDEAERLLKAMFGQAA